MSTTIVREIIAEHAEKQRKQPPPTPKEIQARMVEMINAANGLRYEVARFGDIERQLKAVHERMEPLVLKAKELNDLVCERVSQASQPWANSCIHDAEELLQKVQQLERENAALRRDVYQCPPTSENGYEGLKWADACEVIERDNAELHNKLVALQHQSQWQCSCGGTDCEGQKENAALREDRDRLVKTASEVLEAFILHKKVETGHPCPENMCICIDLRSAIDAARAKEGQL